MTLLDVMNAGLWQIGQGPVTSADYTTPVTDLGRTLARDGVNWIQSVMRDVDWACLTARMILQNNGSVALTLSSAAIGTGVTATPASAYFTARDVGRTLYEVGFGLTGIFQITSVSSASPPVATGNVTGTFAGTALAAQGWYLKPLSAYKSAYLLPADCLKFRGIADGDGFYASHHYRHGGAPIRWEVEAGQIMTDAVRATAPNTNASSVYPVGVYTYYETSPDAWDRMLLEAVEARVAAEMAWTTKNPKLVQDKWSIYKAKTTDAEGVTRTERQRHGYPRDILTRGR